VVDETYWTLKATLN